MERRGNFDFKIDMFKKGVFYKSQPMKIKKMTKGCLMVVGAIFTPLILFLLITGGVMLYHNIFNHDEHEFSLCTGDGEYGYRSVILCKGDTTIIIPHNAKGNREMEGKYFKFHDKNGKTDTKFISCDCGWWPAPCGGRALHDA